MKRLLERELMKWKDSPHRKPLIIKGARQCGKTFLIKSFAEENYIDVAYFNFEETKNVFVNLKVVQ